MADLTWAPEVVEAIARKIDPERWAQLDAMDPSDRAFLPLMIAERMRVDAALASSPLPAALDLIERLNTVWIEDSDGMEEMDLDAVAEIIADAAAFVARVRGS